MKSNNKVSAQFSAKLSAILTKFKDNSTVQVGHEQLKSLFGQFIFKDIFSSFISKMDNSDQLNEREKKQYAKVYITFVDCYKDQILFDQFFDKLVESINKKQYGVSQVIGHICKTVLNRIQILQHIYSYVIVIINVCHHHLEIAKILKQIIESLPSFVVREIQDDVLTIVMQKINGSKNKCQFMDTVLSLVLCLEQNLSVEAQVGNLVAKFLKGQDWNCRKICVDISYAILVIRKQISATIHAIVKELKYDKIKHVRDSVNNYEQLHKQIFGQQVIPKVISSTITGKKREQISSPSQRKINKSPIPSSQHQRNTINPTRDKSKSIDKNVKKQKNQNFFKNAKNNDVIVVHQQNKSMIELRNQQYELKDTINLNLSTVRQQQANYNFRLDEPSFKESPKNFQSYLKDRASPKAKQHKYPLTKTYSPKSKQGQIIINNTDRIKRESEMQSQKVMKFNYQSQFEQFKKKKKVNQALVTGKVHEENNQSAVQESFMKNRPQIHISQISARTENSQYQQLKALFLNFQAKMLQKVNNLQNRIQMLQRQRQTDSISGQRSPFFEQNQIKYKSESQKSRKNLRSIENSQRMVSQSGYRLQSPRNSTVNESINQSKWENSDFEGIQSNLQQKIRISMVNENWDEAFTIALTNNKKNVMLNLFQKCVFPKDKTVQQCILLEIKKLLHYISTLKWLKYFLMERQMSYGRLNKLKEELIRKGASDNRNYEMMKQLLLNQIQERIKKSQFPTQF